MSISPSLPVVARRFAGPPTFARNVLHAALAPVHEHAVITGIAAAHAAYELLSVMAPRP